MLMLSTTPITIVPPPLVFSSTLSPHLPPQLKGLLTSLTKGRMTHIYACTPSMHSPTRWHRCALAKAEKPPYGVITNSCLALSKNTAEMLMTVC